MWSYRVERPGVLPDTSDLTLVLPETPPSFPRFDPSPGASGD